MYLHYHFWWLSDNSVLVPTGAIRSELILMVDLVDKLPGSLKILMYSFNTKAVGSSVVTGIPRTWNQKIVFNNSILRAQLAHLAMCNRTELPQLNIFITVIIASPRGKYTKSKLNCRFLCIWRKFWIKISVNECK